MHTGHWHGHGAQRIHGCPPQPCRQGRCVHGHSPGSPWRRNVHGHHAQRHGGGLVYGCEALPVIVIDRRVHGCSPECFHGYGRRVSEHQRREVRRVSEGRKKRIGCQDDEEEEEDGNDFSCEATVSVPFAFSPSHISLSFFFLGFVLQVLWFVILFFQKKKKLFCCFPIGSLSLFSISIFFNQRDHFFSVF